MTNFLKWMLSLFFLTKEKISSVVKDNIGANHLSRHSRIIFKTNVQLFLFVELLNYKKD